MGRFVIARLSTAVDGAGRYETNSKFKLPASAKGKTYTVKTELASNGKTYKQNSYKVAFVDDGQMIVLAMASSFIASSSRR